MSDDEDDYLSDKFLAAPTVPATTDAASYSQRRKEAAKRSAALNVANRTKSRRDIEREAREAGLERSLFQRAEEEAAQGRADSGGSKALAMMMRMGFKPGEALGKKEEEEEEGTSGVKEEITELSKEATPVGDENEPGISARPARSVHRVEPLPLNEWTGRKGIGVAGTKRALSPEAAAALENATKGAKLAEAESVDAFRDRARREHEERRAEGQLRAAQRTCVSCDENAGKQFNVFWLNPEASETFPPGLLDALEDDAYVLAPSVARRRTQEDTEARLREQMRADALQPLDAEGDVVGLDKTQDASFSTETVEETKAFLRASAVQRLEMVLGYLRGEYSYCFWCGTQYNNAEDLEANCPGEDEEAHD